MPTALAAALAFIFTVGVAPPNKPVTGAPSPPPPNVVLLIIDDMQNLGDDFFERFDNFNDIFIKHGVRFTNMNGNDPLCCPGRANIYSGQWAHHNGVIRNDARLFDQRESIFTEFHSAGYYTFIAGKWFNKTKLLANKLPLGLDHAAVMQSGYYNYQYWDDNVEGKAGGSPDDYSTDFFAGKAMEYLEAAPANKPVFATLTPYAVHKGADENGERDHLQPVPAPRHLEDPRCDDVPRYKPANFNEKKVKDKPHWVRRIGRLGKYYKGGYPMQKMCRTFLSVDEEIGRIADELKRQGRFENTLWVVTADNGWGAGSHRWKKKNAPYTTEVIMYASWPAGRGNLSGRVDFPVTNVDLAPTLCEFAGCEMDHYPNGYAVDGQSFGALIAPRRSSSLPSREAILMEHHTTGGRIPTWMSIKTTNQSPLGLWHFVYYPDSGEKELYDISGGSCLEWQKGDPGDPCELSNKANKPDYAVLVGELSLQLLSLWAGSGSTTASGSTT